MYLFVDTETTGLPLKRKASVTDIDNWPRMVQIAWLVYDENQKLISEKNYIIKPDNYVIPREVSKIHGITTTYAKKNGINLQKVLDEFMSDLQGVKKVIAHNIEFDEKIIGAEFIRNNMKHVLEEKELFCTMKGGVNICKIQKGKNKYKLPSLDELYYKLFEETFDNRHNALGDIKACARCFWEIQNIEETIMKDGNNENVSKKNKIKDLVFDDIAEEILNITFNTSKNLFLTGKAGTGKSTLLKYYIENSKKNIAILAPTGVAALNVGGSTIHSFFRIPPTITLEDVEDEAFDSIGKKLYTKLDTIVIDEISMVRADLLDCIDKYLKIVRENDNSFGGVQMIFVGDLYQLPPVVTSNDKEFFNSVYSSPYFFDSKAVLDSNFDMELIELQKVYRQTDNLFVEILNSIRNKSINDYHIQKLNMNVVGENYDIKDGYLYLTGRNSKVDMINKEELEKLDGEIFEFDAKIEGNFKKNQYPTEQILRLKIGSQIMFMANDMQGRRVNGSVGKIIDMYENIIKIHIYNGEIVEVAPYTWNVRQYFYNKSLNSLSSETIGSFTQYPISLAWAITIHKSQGKTFDKVIVDLSSGTFAHGQTYVALSRCTSLDGLSLVNPIKSGHVIMDWKIMDFMTKYQYQKSEKTMSLEEKIKFIENIIEEGKEIEIVYLKARDEKSKRKIKPIEVGEMFYAGRAFPGVSCYCYKAKDQRVFRVDRILEIKEISGI